jgi:hypothetical protein
MTLIAASQARPPVNEKERQELNFSIHPIGFPVNASGVPIAPCD